VADGDVWLTAWLRPRSGGDLDVERARTLGATPPSGRSYATRAGLAAQTTCDPKDIDVLQRYCATFGIEVVATHWRSIVLSGPIRKLIEAFGATTAIYETPDGRRFRLRTESLHAPPEIAAILRGLFGIHQWPRSHAVGTLHGDVTPLSAQEVAARYELPNADGSGQTVGVLQLRGAFRPDDFTKCMQDQGVAAKLPTVRFCVRRQGPRPLTETPCRNGYDVAHTRCQGQRAART
jgi:hypothetical protein